MRSNLKILILVFLACIFLFNLNVLTFAIEYPTKPIKLIIPYNPGGGSDISARIFSKYAEEYFGQPLVVANISGAAGSVGCLEALNSKPDGYTLLWHHSAMHVAYHTGVADFTWDDFTPVCQGAFSMNAIAVKKDAPWKSIDDLMSAIKENPGKIKMGAGIGSTNHFIGVEMDLATGGGNLKFVAGGGDSDLLIKLLGGFIDYTGLTISSAIDFMKDGKVRLLAVTGPKRSVYLPDIPTLQEKGYNVTCVKDYNVYAPKGLPDEICSVISNNFKEMTEDKRVINDLKKLCVTALYRNQDDTIKQIFSEDVRYYKLARFAGLIK